MDFLLKSHWHWQLGTLHNANQQGRKALKVSHEREFLHSQGWEKDEQYLQPFAFGSSV